MPEAVVRGGRLSSGSYDKLGLKFQTYNRWTSGARIPTITWIRY